LSNKKRKINGGMLLRVTMKTGKLTLKILMTLLMRPTLPTTSVKIHQTPATLRAPPQLLDSLLSLKLLLSANDFTDKSLVCRVV